MTSIPTSASGAMTSTSAALLDRARQRLTAIRTAAMRRLQTATSAFRERYTFERTAPTAAAVGVPREVILCGFLFPEEGESPVPLYEGQFVIDDGAVRFPRPDETPTRWLRIDRDFAEVVDPEEGPLAKRFHSNDAITLGAKRYLVKLVDPACRLTQTVEIDAAGGAR